MLQTDREDELAVIRLASLAPKNGELKVARSPGHRLSLNFGAEVRFEVQFESHREIVVFSRNSLLFLPVGLSLVMRNARGRDVASRRRTGGVLRDTLSMEVHPELFDKAAQSLQQAGAPPWHPEPLNLRLDAAGLALTQSMAISLRQRPPAALALALVQPLVQAVAAWVLTHRDENLISRRVGGPARGLQRALRRIDTEFDQELSLRCLADTAGMSAHHFARVFKAETGQSTYQYILNLRLDRALVAMGAARQNGQEVRVGQVAMDAGFATHSQFTALFRRRFQLTPRQWVERQPRRGA